MSNFKKYYWLKLFDNFFDDPKVKKLKRLAGGDTYIVILLRLMLLTIKNNGVYIYQGLENSLAKELELILDEPEEHIQAVLIYLEKTDMIKEVSKNNFLLVDVPMMLGSETTTAERMRKSRAKKKQLNCNNVTPLLQNVPNCYTEIEKEIDIEIDNLSPKSSLIENELEIKSELDHELIKIFISHRKEIKYPMTQQALNLFVKKLERLAEKYDPQELIDEAIINGWRSVFPLKANNGQTKSYSNPTSSAIRNTFAKLEKLQKEKQNYIEGEVQQ